MHVHLRGRGIFVHRPCIMFFLSVICLLHERVLKKRKKNCIESCFHRRCVKNLKHGIIHYRKEFLTR